MAKVQLLTPFQHLSAPLTRLIVAIESLDLQYVQEQIGEDLMKLDSRLIAYSDTDLGITKEDFSKLYNNLAKVFCYLTSCWPPSASFFLRDQLMGRGKSFTEILDIVRHLVERYCRYEKWCIAAIPQLELFIVHRAGIEINLEKLNPRSENNFPDIPDEIWKNIHNN